MTNQNFDLNSFVDAGKQAFAPAAKFNELALQGFERMARQHYVFAGEWLDYSLQQLQLMTAAKDFNDLASKQLELTTQFAEKATQRTQDLVKLSVEQQAEISKWFEQAAAEAAQQAKKAA